jgi:phosphohistidine phosphatase SixA
MKYCFLYCIVLLCSCAPTRSIYLVRHAEKIDSSTDADLSEAGKLRAQTLRQLLIDQGIQSIYSTNFQRTRKTAQPLADALGIAIIPYHTDTIQKFAVRLLQSSGNSLVVGHSNSTINLLDALGVQHKIQKIDETDYNNLFFIKQKGSKLSLEEKKY